MRRSALRFASTGSAHSTHRDRLVHRIVITSTDPMVISPIGAERSDELVGSGGRSRPHETSSLPWTTCRTLRGALSSANTE